MSIPEELMVSGYKLCYPRIWAADGRSCEWPISPSTNLKTASQDFKLPPEVSVEKFMSSTFVVFQSLSRIGHFGNPWIAACQASEKGRGQKFSNILACMHAKLLQ